MFYTLREINDMIRLIVEVQSSEPDLKKNFILQDIIKILSAIPPR